MEKQDIFMMKNALLLLLGQMLEMAIVWLVLAVDHTVALVQN